MFIAALFILLCSFVLEVGNPKELLEQEINIDVLQ